MKPIEKLLSEIKFKPITPELIVKTDDTPYVTHEGILDLSGFQIQVLQLSNGQKVVDKGEIDRVYGLVSLYKLANG